MGPRGACDLDLRSVELLQGRSPVCCAGDYRYICDQIDTGAVFPCIRDPAAREGVSRRALSISTMIPSLQTFMKDSKYLLPCALAMRQLMPDAADETVQTSLSTYYEPDQGASAGCPEFFDAYRTLWLYTMRHFPDLAGELPLLDGRGRGRRVFSPPETLARRRGDLAYLARSLGFNSPQIRSLMEKGSSTVESLSYHPRGKPALTHRKGRWKLRNCCGMPSESSYLQSRPFMTLNNIDQPLGGCDGEILTPFAVARNVFQAFLGHLPALPKEPVVLHTYAAGNSPDSHRPLVQNLQDHGGRAVSLSPPVHALPPQACVRNTQSRRTSYTPSLYPSSNPQQSLGLSQGSSREKDFVGLVGSNPFLESSASTPTMRVNPRVLPMPQRSQPTTNPGLQGEKTLVDPTDLQPFVRGQTSGEAVLYEVGSPALVYRLPLARLPGLCQVYSRGHPDFWYAIWTEDQLRAVEPATVPDYLRSDVVIAGPAKHWRRAQAGRFTSDRQTPSESPTWMDGLGYTDYFGEDGRQHLIRT